MSPFQYVTPPLQADVPPTVPTISVAYRKDAYELAVLLAHVQAMHGGPDTKASLILKLHVTRSLKCATEAMDSRTSAVLVSGDVAKKTSGQGKSGSQRVDRACQEVVRVCQESRARPQAEDLLKVFR